MGMENSENSEIVPATSLIGYCPWCDLEDEHLGECEWEDDSDDDDDDHEPRFYEDDVWADSNALASAGWGTDEDYGYYGDDY